MSFPVRLKWSTASVGSSHAPTDAVDHSAPSAIRPESTYISGKVVQTNGATSEPYFLTHWRVGRNLYTSLRKFGNPLSIRYFSVAPYLFGDNAVKYSLTPRNPQDTPVPKNPSDHYLREAMAEQLADGDAVFDFSVQFQKDPYREPIEDPGITWSEARSPFRRVGTLTIPSQSFESAQRLEFGDNLSFNPWRCLAQHRPLGGINRARRRVYEALSIFRHEKNYAPRVEPTVHDEEWTSEV